MMDTLFAVLEHRLGNVSIDSPVDDVKQRVQGPVSIPNGKDGIVGETFRLMDILVDAPVFPVDIGIDTGIDQRIIELGVEHRQLIVVALRVDARQGLFPAPSCRLGQLIEIVAQCFGFQVLQGAFGTDSGKGNLDLQLF